MAARWLATTALPLALLGVWAAPLDYGPERDLLLIRATGLLALAALLLSLSVSPIARVWPLGSAAAWRRRFGLAAALFGALHATWVATTAHLETPLQLLTEPQLRAGAAALLILLPLALTSSPRRIPTRAWKPLHRLSYAAGALALLHLALAPRASVELLIIATFVLAAGLLLRPLSRRRRPG